MMLLQPRHESNTAEAIRAQRQHTPRERLSTDMHRLFFGFERANTDKEIYDLTETLPPPIIVNVVEDVLVCNTVTVRGYVGENANRKDGICAHDEARRDYS